MSISRKVSNHIFNFRDTDPFFNYMPFKRFSVTISLDKVNYPTTGGYVIIQVMAKNAKQARAHARKEMLKMMRNCVNKAEVVDCDPEVKDERRRF